MVNVTMVNITMVNINPWPWKWTFKQQHIIYVKCEYFTNPKVNVMKYIAFFRGIN